MLRRNLELTADMVLAKLTQESVGFIRHDIVIAQTGTHENLFDLRQRTDFAQQLDVIRMIDDHIRTGLREQALTSGTGAELELLVACGAAEVCGRAADIMDIALEVGHLRDGFCFFKNGFMASRGDDAPLQKGNGAEGAGAETAAGVGDGELHLFDSGYAAERVIIRMPCALIWKRIGMIQLVAVQRHIRNGLDEIDVTMLLTDGVTANGILLVILNKECLAVFLFALYTVLERRNFDASAHRRGGKKTDTAHFSAFPGGCAAAHPIRGDENRTLAHAEHQQIRAAVYKDARTNGIVPVVIMREAAQRGFNAADGNRNIAIGFSNQMAVDVDCAIRTLCCLSAGRIDIRRAAAFGGGIMVDHAVNDAGGNEKTVIRTPKAFKIVRIFPLRLSEHGNAITCGFQRADDDCRAEGRVIDICVTADIDKIRCIPTALTHVRNGCGRKKKAICHVCNSFISKKA